MPLTSNYPLITIGTYDGKLIGVDVSSCEKTLTDNKDKKTLNDLKLNQVLECGAHISSVQSICTKGRYLLSGGHDEIITLCNIKRKIVEGTLDIHCSTVSALSISNDEISLLSGGADGTLVITRLSDHEILKKFKAHKRAINSIAMHPSDKMAITCAQGELKLWDIMRGTCAAIMKRSKQTIVKHVVWIDNTRFAILENKRCIEVFDMDSKEDKSLSFKRDIRLPGLSCFCWCEMEKMFIVGAENGGFLFLSMSGEELEEIDVTKNTNRNKNLPIAQNEREHSTRVRGIFFVSRLETCSHLVSVDSSGVLILWKFQNNSLLFVNDLKLNERVTCVSLAARSMHTTRTRPETSVISTKKRKFNSMFVKNIESTLD